MDVRVFRHRLLLRKTVRISSQAKRKPDTKNPSNVRDFLCLLFGASRFKLGAKVQMTISPQSASAQHGGYTPYLLLKRWYKPEHTHQNHEYK